jgi:hypothetical protein
VFYFINFLLFFSGFFGILGFSSVCFLCCFFTGFGIAIVGIILLAPTVNDTGVIVHMCTTGIPALSISLTNVAPQRVQVPHVEVKITASTPSANNSSAVKAPNFLEEATAVPFPTVE